MDIFIENWLLTVLLLLLSAGAWFVSLILDKKCVSQNKDTFRILLSILSLLSNLTLIFLVLVWGGGLEHIAAILMLSLIFMLR